MGIKNKFFTTASITSLAIGLFALLCIGLVVFTHTITLEKINKQQRSAKTSVLTEILNRVQYNNDPLQTSISIENAAALGLADTSSQAYIAALDDQPVAIIMPVITYQGYSGKIEMLVAVDKSHTIIGVRVLQHKETPGLGDKIEKNKSNWIDIFTGRALANTAANKWEIKKYQGDFDQITAATITSRSVINSAYNVLHYLKQHPEIW